MNRLFRDLRYALRQLRHSPGVTAVAVLSLALGIGANAAIFSLARQILFRPLPVPDPQRLVNLSAPGPKPGSSTRTLAGDAQALFSYRMFRDLEAGQTPFSDIAAHRSFVANLASGDQTVSGNGMLVSGSYFPVLGLRPALGRLLGPDDDRAVGGHPVAVLGHRYWHSRLGADPAIVGKRIVVNGNPLTIVGVAPRDFDGTTLGVRPDVFVPLTMAAALRGAVGVGSEEQFEDRRNYWIYLFARLRPGISIEQAQEGVNRLYRPIVDEVEAPLQEGLSDEVMARFRAKEIAVADGSRGQSAFHAAMSAPLTLLLAVTGIVLLIAGANVANLFLARAAKRAPELAIRGSLGAARSRLLAQLLTEACLLAVLGGLASLVVARWTLPFIGAFLPAEVASALELELRPAVLAVAAVLSIVAGLLFGLYPALHSTRPDRLTTTRDNAGDPVGARSAARFRASLVTAQIALSMTLLILAGLFIQSLVNVGRIDLGLRTDNLVAFGISPDLNGYTPGRARVLFQRAEEELAGIPGVSGVAASRLPLLSGRGWMLSVSVAGFDGGPDADDGARYNEVGPNYFRTLGIPLLAGREFTPADAGDAPTVAVVNEAFARKFDLGRDVLGKRMAIGSQESELDLEIVGLVRDASYHQVKQEAPPQFFLPYRQADVLELGELSFYLRTSLRPEDVLDDVPRVISRLDPQLPVDYLKTMPQQVAETVSLDRMIGTLSTAFAALATLLAAVGLYGVIAYTVTQRTREIGLRMALGADSGRVRRMVLAQVARMTLVGGAIGIAAALVLGRAARSVLFQVEGHDPRILAAAALVLTLVALGAAYPPARRAARVNPMTALRSE